MKNEGTVDRVIRAVAGLALAIAAFAALGIAEGAVLGIVAMAVAAVLVGTAAWGFCPAYRLVGIRTCKVPTGSDTAH
ncbi:MAG: DUF2892 domain-containing protein [Planctomycetota bacterium]